MAPPAGLPPSVAEKLTAGAEGPLAGVLVEGGEDAVLQAVKDAAERPGPLLPVHPASPDHPRGPPAYHPDWLLEEVTTSINTTAAGGNASLMALT
jgi:RHH-type transcriptional regulator, proline utilization regulon repressor / proline dehydrogenase / delta 1-pyrroline-5-carboxylate dehydrogenase